MICDEFRCQYADGDICQPISGACVFDRCDCWGICVVCQDLNADQCDGIRKEWEELTGER